MTTVSSISGNDVANLSRSALEHDAVQENRKTALKSAAFPPAPTAGDIAKARMDTLSSALAQIQNARWRLANIDSLREQATLVFGPEEAEEIVRSFTRSAEEALAQEKYIPGFVSDLNKTFQVSGEIVTRSSSGDYELGDFTLTTKDQSFALKADRKNGVFVKEGVEGWKRDTGTFAALTLLGAPKDQSFRTLDIAV